MQAEQAVSVAKAHIEWQTYGGHVTYEKLNSSLLTEALKFLVDIAEKELSEDAAWVSK